MKKLLLLVLASIVSASILGAQVKGPSVDKVIFDVKMQEDLGLKDVAAGNSDAFWYGVSGATKKALSKEDSDKIEWYSVPSSSLSLVLNPWPNAAPYFGKVKDKDLFNPLAIQEVRYAFNFLIDRQKIVDEILNGAGAAEFSAVTPGQPNSSRYDLIANKLGFTPSGNQTKAINDINAALTKASALPELKGRLVKASPFWTFDGEAISVKFFIRVDDPNVRLKEGRFIADLIEKAGIKVERVEADRAKCIKTAYYTDPKDVEWSIYTEGWVGGQTYAFWDNPVTQMYAPWYANMPGNNTEGFWSYANSNIDDWTQDATYGRFEKPAEYFDLLDKAVKTGLSESVRIYIAVQQAYFATNKAKFNTRMSYSMGKGLDKFSIYTADIKPGADKTKTLRISQFSARGALFASAWDPVGTDGFNDIYSVAIAQPLTDYPADANPFTGMYAPTTVKWTDGTSKWPAPYTKLKVVTKDGKKSVEGQIAVPANAVIWNAKTQKWESGVEYKEVEGGYGYAPATKITSSSTGTYQYTGANWHHGRPVTVADFLYAAAFGYNLSAEGGPANFYEKSYADTANPGLINSKGLVVDVKKQTITTFYNANFPMDPAYLASQGAPTLNLQPINSGVAVPWEVAEGLLKLVADGGKSGTKWSFSSDEKFVEVDVLSPKLVADLLVKLQEFIDAKYVPASLVGYVTADEAIKDYKLTIAFLKEYGHAYISNGGFKLDKFNTANNSAVLVANRDASYPFAPGQLAKQLVAEVANITSAVPSAYAKGKDITIDITVTRVKLPANKATLEPKAIVNIDLVGDTTISATAVAGSKAGSYKATLKAADLAKLATGDYTLVVSAKLATESPAVSTQIVHITN